MGFITQICSVWPQDNTWANIIKIFDVGNYVWTILLFTVVLKLILSPLDFLQRYYTNKTTRAQAKIQPELEKLRKRYGQNQNLLYQKQTELYKKNNVSMKGSCIVMLVYMAVTLTVFFTLFSSLQSISNFEIKQQYLELRQEYNTVYEKEYYQDYLEINLEEFNQKTAEQKQQEIETKESEKIEEELQTKKAEVVSFAQQAVVEKYEDVKDTWIWVKNIWRADKPTVTSILSYNDFKTVSSMDISEQEYKNVMGGLLENKTINTANGYYILSIIVVLISFLSQYFMRKTTQPKGVSAQQAGGLSKILMIIMPIAMLMFTLNSSAMFSVYIITNSLITTILTPIISKVCNKIEDKKETEIKNRNKAEYSR